MVDKSLPARAALLPVAAAAAGLSSPSSYSTPQCPGMVFGAGLQEK